MFNGVDLTAERVQIRHIAAQVLQAELQLPETREDDIKVSNFLWDAVETILDHFQQAAKENIQMIRK